MGHARGNGKTAFNWLELMILEYLVVRTRALPVAWLRDNLTPDHTEAVVVMVSKLAEQGHVTLFRLPDTTLMVEISDAGRTSYAQVLESSKLG